MTYSKWAVSILTLAVLAACSGTANITVPNATLNASGNVTDAFNAVDADAQFKALVGTDAVAYKAQTDASQADLWHTYYYSPSKNKSFDCVERGDHTIVSITEVTDVRLIYKANYAVDRSKIKVDATTAKTNAVAAAKTAVSINTGVGVSVGGGGGAGANVDTGSFNDTQVISGQQCADETGKSVDGPVYVLTSVTVNVKVYVSANDGSVIATVAANASVTTGGTASSAPSTAPTATPTATPSADASASGSVDVGATSSTTVTM